MGPKVAKFGNHCNKGYNWCHMQNWNSRSGWEGTVGVAFDPLGSVTEPAISDKLK